MTEDEAKLKQCCVEGGGVENDKPYPARWCVGSMCMAWRAYTIVNEEVLAKAAITHMSNSPGSMTLDRAKDIVLRNHGKPFSPHAKLYINGGFCGRAGPENNR